MLGCVIQNKTLAPFPLCHDGWRAGLGLTFRNGKHSGNRRFCEGGGIWLILRELTIAKLPDLREKLWHGIKKIYPKAQINGDPSEGKSLPNILNVYFPGYEAQDILTKFDMLGLAASSGSACRARASLTSYVIEELGYPKSVPGRASGSVWGGRPRKRRLRAHFGSSKKP